MTIRLSLLPALQLRSLMMMPPVARRLRPATRAASVWIKSIYDAVMALPVAFTLMNTDTSDQSVQVIEVRYPAGTTEEHAGRFWCTFL